MKITLKGLFFNIIAFTCVQNAVAMDYLNNSNVKNAGIVLISAGTGYFVGKKVTNFLEKGNSLTKDVPLPVEAKDINNSSNAEKSTKESITNVIKLASTITAHNEKTKAVREGLVAAGLALISTHVDKTNIIKDTRTKYLSLWLINSFFDTYRACETVWNKTGYAKTYMNYGSLNWSTIGKTATYALAAWAQIKMPSLLHPRLKPVEKILTRSILNKGLEMVFNNNESNLSQEEVTQKKFNESFKDILTSSHAVYSIYKHKK